MRLTLISSHIISRGAARNQFVSFQAVCEELTMSMERMHLVVLKVDEQANALASCSAPDGVIQAIETPSTPLPGQGTSCKPRVDEDARPSCATSGRPAARRLE